MPIQIIDAPQRSDAWLRARVGLATASRADCVLAGSSTKTRIGYRAELIAELLSGEPCESDFSSADMRRGVDLEPDALRAYEVRTGDLVHLVGFIRRTDIAAGCSPDGLVGDDGMVEAKCPKIHTHIGYLRAGELPAEYRPQVTHSLLVSERQWCDFVSYCPKLPGNLSLFVKRIMRADVDLKEYERKLRAFLAEVDNELAALRTITDLRGVLEASA